MVTAWSNARDLAAKHASANGLFVKLPADGDKIIGVFCGEPYAREVLWIDDRCITYDERDPVHKGKKASMRVALNFYVLAERTMKIIEGGVTWFKDLDAVTQQFPIEEHKFQIQRRGGANDPRTSYLFMPMGEVDQSLRSEIAKAELHNIEQVYSGHGPQDAVRSSSLIDPATAINLIERLKQLPRSVTDELLKPFGVQRVKEVKASDAAKLQAAIAKLESGAVDQEIDPFA